MPEFAAPPALLPMYGRATLTGPFRRGDRLPDSVYSLAGASVDPNRLAAYQRMCGFRVSGALPPLYLHLLAFPLSVALMTERTFPFPLVGTVHVANSVTVQRPAATGERFDLVVRAADLRPHPAGRQFDLLAEARVGDEVTWSSRSTYLRRDKGSARQRRERPALPPQPGPAALVRAPGDIGRRYGAVSGDRNPIHLSQLSARAFGFPTAIAHGMWLAARTLATVEGRLPASYTVDMAFKRPVPLPSTVAISSGPTESGWALDVRSRSGTPHLAGTITALG